MIFRAVSVLSRTRGVRLSRPICSRTLATLSTSSRSHLFSQRAAAFALGGAGVFAGVAFGKSDLSTSVHAEADKGWRTTLFDPIEPYNSGMLKVDQTHTIYWEESGNPNGKPVVFVHGGPGGGTNPNCRRFFDPKAYRIILFDQRGAGQSVPFACLENNTTWDLVEDMEKLRKFLKIEKWMVFGGSWGSTLSLSYAETHPDRVSELVLRGIFMIRKKEIDWMYQEGASYIFPDAWEDYENAIPPLERNDFVKAYHKRLTGSNEEEKIKAARAWTKWEMETSFLTPRTEQIGKADDDKFSLAFARIENHYFINDGFFPTDEWLLDQVHRIRHIPTVIAQGRYDVVCPMRSAWDLHRRFPEAEFHVVTDAGHSANEPGITAVLVGATERFKHRK